jgi:hypothetical protein
MSSLYLLLGLPPSLFSFLSFALVNPVHLVIFSNANQIAINSKTMTIIMSPMSPNIGAGTGNAKDMIGSEIEDNMMNTDII